MTSITTARAQNAAHAAAVSAIPGGSGADRAAFLLACAADELRHHDELADALRGIHAAMTGDPADILLEADAAAKELMGWAETQDSLDHGEANIARRAA